MTYAKNLDIWVHIRKSYKRTTVTGNLSNMLELKDIIIITNNSKVEEKYKNTCEVIFVNNYEEVLITTRDYVYNKHKLLTHPQASSLKPNQTPFRSIMICRSEDNSNNADQILIDKCIQVYKEWQEISPAPKSYEKKVEDDFKTIDLSIIDNCISRI